LINLFLTIEVDNIQIGNMILPPDTLIIYRKMLLANFYVDSMIDIKIFGNNALCATLVLFEYEKSSGKGGPQDAFISPFNLNKPLLKVYPKPFSEKINIRYTIHDARCMIYNIKIYDATGKLVRQWDYETMRLSDKIAWNGTDDAGLKLPAGVYFVQLCAGDYKQVEKVIFVK